MSPDATAAVGAGATLLVLLALGVIGLCRR